MNKGALYVRPLHPGMGVAVAERTILRQINGEWEGWGDVATRVALGNSLLCPAKADRKPEFELIRQHVAKATLLMSGRHLQHGDASQPTRNQEVFTNCATAACSFILFYLLLNGSGVGRCYDDDMMLVDWNNAPNLRVVLDHTHSDFDWSAHESARDAKHKYKGKDVLWYEVPDSREGWAQALELWENAAFEKIHKDKILILDFSKVRCKNSPIAGMQNRPASGPVPLMNAFMKASSLKGSGLDPWRQALYVDHYFAECVLVGGARRSARLSTKYWRDLTVIDFIKVKRPIEFESLKMEEIVEYRNRNGSPNGFLWSSNNSVMVDAEFWRLNRLGRKEPEYSTPLAKHARLVLRTVKQCSFADGTGEPGLINVDKLVQKDEGWDELTSGPFVGPAKYVVSEDTELYLKRLASRAKKKPFHMTCNPCSEIVLNILGAYCVIADVVPYHADTLAEAEEAFRVATRALMRVNLMDSLYKKEVARTNRIGVGMTGVHEFAWKFFKVGFRDLINPDFTRGSLDPEVEDWPSDEPALVDLRILSSDPRQRAAAFWLTLASFNEAVRDEATKYAAQLGVKVPHTMTCMKPAGTTSKLFGLTEGWHLPSMMWFVRWVQFRSDDPKIEKWRNAGYPVRNLVQYQGTTIVGFPTEPTICSLGMGDKLVTAADATPEEQYKWLMLGEKYWIQGIDHKENIGNQISYTLKYDPKKVDFKQFSDMLSQYQSEIRACAVMPQEDASAAAYEYLPEQPVSKAEYEEIAFAIRQTLREDIGREHMDCAKGGCPVDVKEDVEMAA